MITVLAATTIQAQAPEDEKVYKVGGAVSRPRVISKVEAEYTPEALKAGRQGSVILQVVVTPDGEASDIHVLRSPGFGLDEKAVEAVKQWTFQPATKYGNPVAMKINVQVDFHLYK